MAEVFKNEQTENPHCSKARLQTDKKRGKKGKKKQNMINSIQYILSPLNSIAAALQLKVLLIKMLQS